MSIQPAQFEHWVMEGTPYEVGKFQGEAIKRHPSTMRFLKKSLREMDYASKKVAHDILRLYRQYSPGLIEEVQGCADSLSLAPEKLIFYTMSYPKAGQCSQIAITQEATDNHHVLVGRNYDMDPHENPTILCTTRIKGKYAHIGFSYMLFDRVDGMNEQGLSLTMTQAGPGSMGDYYVDVFYRRTILDLCKNIDEAIDLFKDMPNYTSSNMMIADKKGNCALFELGLNGRRALKAISKHSCEKYLFTTNHYTLPSMVSYYSNCDENSKMRYTTIRDFLRDESPNITKADLMMLLSARMPSGLFNSTLWSMVFDLTDTKAYIRFGAPKANPWRKYGLEDPVGITTEQVKYVYYI